MQLPPSNKTYSNAWKEIRDFVRKYSTSEVNTLDDLSQKINETLSAIAHNENGTVKYKPLKHGYLPESFAMNEFIQALAHDVNVLFDETEVLAAGSAHNYNFIQTELLKSQNINKRIHSKIKTLQMYSESEDSSIISYGDFFFNDDSIDWSVTPASNRAKLQEQNYVTLGAVEEVSAIDSDSKIEIMPGSNGIVGNNQQVDDNGNFINEFVFKTPEVEIENILDGNPNTFFEFETYKVSAADKSKADNLNFKSINNTSNPIYEYLSEEQLIDWSLGPSNGRLELFVIVDLGSSKRVNQVKFTPYGLTDGSNPPLTIENISLSEDKSNWTQVNEFEVTVANGIDQNSVITQVDTINIGEYSISFSDLEARYVLLHIVQPNSINVSIGHMYYTQDEVRVLGPRPTVDKIYLERMPNFENDPEISQEREILSGQRWVIGIRDIDISLVQYQNKSEFVSKRIDVPGGVDRVSLEADIVLPEAFDRSSAWVRFYVSPNDGLTWHRISRIEENDIGVPEVLAYNENTPVEYRSSGIGYYDLSYTPTKLSLRIELDGLADNNKLTPILNSYKLKIKRRLS